MPTKGGGTDAQKPRGTGEQRGRQTETHPGT